VKIIERVRDWITEEWAFLVGWGMGLIIVPTVVSTAHKDIMIVGFFIMYVGIVGFSNHLNRRLDSIEGRIGGRRCPKCGGFRVTYAPGGTCIEPVNGLHWICSECLYEW